MCFSRRGGLVAALLLFSSAVACLAEANAEAVSQQPICGTADLSGLRSRIYVAPAGRDSADCGATPASACASIQHGIDRCASAGCGVLVRHGLFKTTATIALRDGVGVYGSCVFDGKAGHPYRTVVQAKPAAGTPAISADAINAPTALHGLVVVGTKETQPGTASVTMTAHNSRGLVVGSTVLSSGAGGPGAAGASATAAAGPGEDGTAARVGSWGWPGVGGNSCPSNHTTDDGKGARGYTQAFSATCDQVGFGTGGSSGSVPGGTGGQAGTPGIWCSNRPHDQPGDGTDGLPGGAGQAGALARAAPLVAGTIIGTRWQPGKGGEDGKAGVVGSGGGGGGSGGSCDTSYPGHAGAAGGGGGCGGTAGTGGQQGGASIVLVLSASRIDFVKDSVSIIPGGGGRGGNGGSAASGGSGGAGGSGVKQGYQNLYWARWCPGHSGNGGAGGPGGAGSGGAGGNGGPSLGVALVEDSPAPPADMPIYPGLPGNGGSHGSGGPAITAHRVTSPAGPDGEDGLTGATAPWLKY